MQRSISILWHYEQRLRKELQRKLDAQDETGDVWKRVAAMERLYGEEAVHRSFEVIFKAYPKTCRGCRLHRRSTCPNRIATSVLMMSLMLGRKRFNQQALEIVDKLPSGEQNE